MSIRIFPLRARGSRCVVLATVCVLAGPGAPGAWGQWEEIQKLNAEDGTTGDRFGVSVSVGGGVAIVGAWADDDAGSSSGSAYLFDVATGQQLHKLTAKDGAGNDLFGFSVGTDGNIAIVGAYLDDDAGNNSGSAYLFDVATGQQLHKLAPIYATGGDEFGRSVAISGNIAIVGAWRGNNACTGVGDCDSGSAYLFDAATGDQLFKLAADDETTDDQFGRSVAISGGVAIVGAWADDHVGSNSGSAYLFDVATGKQLNKLTPADPSAGDNFGISVSLDGSVAIIGAWHNDEMGGNSGSAYLFNVATGQQLHKLTASDAAAGDQFGISVSIDGDIVIVGASTDDDAGGSSGAAYLFDAATGQQLEKLTASDAAASDEFGVSVSIDGGFAVVGAHADDDAGNNSGSVYVFEQGGCPDLDDDGMVGVGDLLILFANWGTPGPGDFNGDGIVGVGDMLIMFANWGPCP